MENSVQTIDNAGISFPPILNVTSHSLQTPVPIQRKVAIAACFGTFLEWYDFLTFASLATYFSLLFFPPDNPVAALLASLATFGVGMLVRPLGAALFGSLADKYGRRPIFIATIVLMGLSTFCVGLLPTYQQVGMLAPALLLVLRLLQGFSVGGACRPFPGGCGGCGYSTVMLAAVAPMCSASVCTCSSPRNAVSDQSRRSMRSR